MTMTLEPCPFCGGKAKVDHDSWYGWWQTGCTECGCKISEVECYSEADAIAAWNRRTHPTQPAQDDCPVCGCVHDGRCLCTRPHVVPVAQAVVTDAVVQRAEQAFWPAYTECTRVHGARKNAHATGMRAALLAVWPKLPAMQDDWRIGFFERWREAAHEKGYAGVAETITAAPTAFLHGTAPAFAQPAVRMVEEWVMVPREPAKAMLAAYEHVRSGADWQENVFRLTKKQLARHKAAYKALLAVAADLVLESNHGSI